MGNRLHTSFGYTFDSYELDLAKILTVNSLGATRVGDYAVKGKQHGYSGSELKKSYPHLLRDCRMLDRHLWDTIASMEEDSMQFITRLPEEKQRTADEKITAICNAYEETVQKLEARAQHFEEFGAR